MITPTGDIVIEPNDKVVMCVLHEAIHELEEFYLMIPNSYNYAIHP